MKKLDIILICSIFCFSFLALIFVRFISSDGRYASIYMDGILYGKYQMNEELIITVTGDNHSNVVEISNGMVRMLESDCANQICVNQGFISRNREAILCAPNKVLIVVETENEGEYDEISY